MFAQKGVIVHIDPEWTSIETKNGVIKKKKVMLEYEEGMYKKRIVFDWCDDAPYEFNLGCTATVLLSVDATEYNGRWYNRIRCEGMVMPSSPRAYFPLKGAAENKPRKEKGDYEASDFNY